MKTIILLFVSIVFLFGCGMSYDIDPAKWEFGDPTICASIFVNDTVTGNRIPGAQFGDSEYDLDDAGWIWIEEPGSKNKTISDSVHAPGYKSKLLWITLIPCNVHKNYNISLSPI